MEERAEGRAPRFVGIEGMRAIAACSILIFHCSQLYATDSRPVFGQLASLLRPFWLGVTAFFVLSGFLLYRPFAAAIIDGRPLPSIRRYLRHRVFRILPAYWVVVCVALTLLPSAAHSAGLRVWGANLALVQVFVPLTLTDGLTQMWSLSVEVAFYLVLPLLAWALAGLRGSAARQRVFAVTAIGVLCLGWNFLPVPTPDAIHADNWLPGYLPWFAAGMVLAELAEILGARSRDEDAAPRWQRWFGDRRLMWSVAAVAFALSATDLAGPAGLARAAAWQYAMKMGLGALIGFGLLAPLVVGVARHRLLESRLALTIGRWSYGIFIWHLVVLAMMFPIFGFIPFNGGFLHVLALTVAFTIPLAAASYALVEEPVRQWVKRRFG